MNQGQTRWSPFVHIGATRTMIGGSMNVKEGPADIAGPSLQVFVGFAR
jgi:hypothetical protein